jgi:hypothetical protein
MLNKLLSEFLPLSFSSRPSSRSWADPIALSEHSLEINRELFHTMLISPTSVLDMEMVYFDELLSRSLDRKHMNPRLMLE